MGCAGKLFGKWKDLRSTGDEETGESASYDTRKLCEMEKIRDAVDTINKQVEEAAEDAIF